PRADDGRPVPAGLLARGSCTSPPPSRRLARQWHEEATLAAYSCGGSHGFEAPPTGFASHRVPFSPAATPKDDSGTVTRQDRSSRVSELSTRCAPAPTVHSCIWHGGNGGGGVRPSGSDTISVLG